MESFGATRQVVDHVQVPLGQPRPSKVKSTSLLYNEYVFAAVEPKRRCHWPFPVLHGTEATNRVRVFASTTVERISPMTDVSGDVQVHRLRRGSSQLEVFAQDEVQLQVNVARPAALSSTKKYATLSHWIWTEK